MRDQTTEDQYPAGVHMFKPYRSRENIPLATLCRNFANANVVNELLSWVDSLSQIAVLGGVGLGMGGGTDLIFPMVREYK